MRQADQPTGLLGGKKAFISIRCLEQRKKKKKKKKFVSYPCLTGVAAATDNCLALFSQTSACARWPVLWIGHSFSKRFRRWLGHRFRSRFWRRVWRCDGRANGGEQ